MAKNHHRNGSWNRSNSLSPRNNEPSPQPVPVGQPVAERIGIEPPPDYIFKYRAPRTDVAQKVWGAGGTVSYIPIKGEYIEGKGNFVHYRDCPYPSRTIAPVEAIYAGDQVKRFLITILRIASKLGRKGFVNNTCIQFNLFANLSLRPFYLKDEYYSSPSKEIRAFIRTFLINIGVQDDAPDWTKDEYYTSVADRTAEIFAALVEYDNAYRYRLQDMFGETTKEKLENLPKEIKRLIMIGASREVVGTDVTDRFKSVGKLIRLMWWIPKYRKALKKAIQAINLENLVMNEMDEYHTYLYGDYNVKGLTFEERLNKLREIHGTDETKWPPRILIRTQGF